MLLNKTKWQRTKPSFQILIIIVAIIILPSFSQAQVNQNDLKKSSTYNIITSNSNLIDSISVNSIPEVLKQLNELKIKSGTVFLWGAGFPNTIIVKISGRPNFPDKIVEKFTTGTKITFEHCVFQNEKGEIIKTLHKTLILK